MNSDNRLKNLEHTVFGNGQPGLKLDVAILKKDVNELSDIKARLARVERSIWAAGGAIVLIEFLAKLLH